MSRESFGEKLNRVTESIPEDIDKIPPPESYPEPMQGEGDDGFPDHLLEEELIDEEENKRQENDTEEINRSPKPEEKPKQKKLTPREKIEDDLEINKKIIELQSEINTINKGLEIETDERKIEMFKEHLKDLESERNKLLESR